MSKLTALQEAMRIVEKYAPNLFNVFSQDSRDFLNEVKPYLEKEKQQIIDAYNYGQYDYEDAIGYYNKNYGAEP